jgi:hypothetical protein
MNEEKVIELLLKHNTDIEWLKENSATKHDLQSLENRILTVLDEILGHVKKNDQEITFMGARITRLEKQASTK